MLQKNLQHRMLAENRGRTSTQRCVKKRTTHLASDLTHAEPAFDTQRADEAPTQLASTHLLRLLG
eukprot:COSAG03_NODE_6578_length_1038_cov_0.888179_1_plen_64_part_10